MSVWLAKQHEALEHVLSNPSEEPIKLSYPFIQTITQDFAEEIGRGGFGVVYLGTLPGGKIAVKKLLSSSHDLSDKLFTDEVNFLIRVKHENIVRFLGYCADTQGEMMEYRGRFVLTDVRQRILCFEYVPNGSIYDYLKGEPSRDEWHMRYQVIRGICQGLNYLHEQFINHLDLKPENVMLDTQWKPKITDFGLSRSFDEGQSRVFTRNIFGTPGYIAPEAIDKGELSYKSDIFSLGIIIIKLLTGRNKYDLDNWHNLLDIDGPEAKICIKIAQTCLHADQHKRPTIGEIIHWLDELQTVIRNTVNDRTSLENQVIKFSSMQEKKPYTRSGSLSQVVGKFADDSSLHSGIAHLKVIDEKPLIVSPNSDDSSLQSGMTQTSLISQEKPDATQHSGDEDNRPPENYIFCQQRVYEEYQPDETNTMGINTSKRPHKCSPRSEAKKQMASGVFGIPISAATVIATGEYEEPITQKDVADYAMKMINAGSKDIEAQEFVDNLKDRYGKGISAKCLIYNATGTTLDWVTYKDWFGCVYENYDPHYPSSIQNGQWGAFLHVQGFMSGSTSAVVYRTNSLCDWLFSWSIPLIGNNGVYTEIREEGHFPKHWQYIYDARLPKSSRSSTDTGYGYVSKSEIGRGGTANVRAVFHLPY